MPWKPALQSGPRSAPYVTSEQGDALMTCCSRKPEANTVERFPLVSVPRHLMSPGACSGKLHCHGYALYPSAGISGESFPSSSQNQTKLLKCGVAGKKKREGRKESGELYVGHLGARAKHEQQGSCVGHECSSNSFLTCDIQPSKDWWFNVVLRAFFSL